ncbi:MAG: radical SAM protein [Deltaproteobacteria bacterium]|nr:radical SAM protein [Deltaproteobacteria bacterium]
MSLKIGKSTEELPPESGVIRKGWHGRIRVALVYPNVYSVGMANLGFQRVYQLFNEAEHIVCERVFLPQDTQRQVALRSIESGRPLSDFDVIAFSISFENDYPNLLTILKKSGIGLRSSDRRPSDPLVISGGVACMMNPEPLALFVDCFLIGEAEAILPDFLRRLETGIQKAALLKILAQTVPGAYVPAFYSVTYQADGTLAAMIPPADVPQRITRVFPPDLAEHDTCSQILSGKTSFADTYLVEVSRGCPHGCRFCSAGYIYRPPRYRPSERLTACLVTASSLTDQVGLVGAAVSDLPDLNVLCEAAIDRNLNLRFSSLRADALSAELLSAMKKSGVKTATIAPDAGSERMRRVINKGLDENQILQATERLVAAGILNLKLYFMIGLPSETSTDVLEIVSLCKRIKNVFLSSSRAQKRIGEITVSLNAFVPKPVTPFQWAAMDSVSRIKSKIKTVRGGLKRIPNVRFQAEAPKWSYIQALLSRGDRRVSELLLAAHRCHGNWPQVLKAAQADFYALRSRDFDETLPWDFIDHGVDKDFLRREFKRALKGKSTAPCPVDDQCKVCGACR